MTATLQRMVRDPRTGEVHMPRESLSIIGLFTVSPGRKRSSFGSEDGARSAAPASMTATHSIMQAKRSQSDRGGENDVAKFDNEEPVDG
jgi:hypothetical protein